MRRVILVGFMGSGKTTLGKKVANRLNVPFIDSDQEIEKNYQMSIGDIFGSFGESRFREIETDFIRSYDDEGEFVMAVGGGTPCFNKNMEHLNKLGVTFYLERSAKELSYRLENAKTRRPMLSGLSEGELLLFIEDKLAVRDDFYKMP